MKKTVNGLTYKQWYKRVDEVVFLIAGVGVEDLVDGLSVDAWRDEWSPREYATDRLEAEGFPF